MYMLGDLNEDLLKVNRLEQILNKLNLYQLIKEPTTVTPRSKTHINVIITNNRYTVVHAETSLSISDNHAVIAFCCVSWQPVSKQMSLNCLIIVIHLLLNIEN